MKSTIIQPVIFVFAAIIACGANVQAQEQNGRVAILDVAKVFKENKAFDAQMKAIKAEADQLKQSITAEQETIKTQAQKLTSHERGTPERNKLEAELEQKQTALRTKARQAEADLLNREARVYYLVYQHMQAVVESVANEEKLSLVLRFDSQPIDPNNRNEVIKGVNRAVVFHRQLDLTEFVSAQLNARLAQGGGGANQKR